jgi:cell division protease FtsH
MDVKRIFRGPWFWIVIAVVGVLVALQYLAPNGGYEEIDTAEMVKHINDGDIAKITFIDGDQEIRATLKDDDKKILTHWVDGQQSEIISQAQKQFNEGNIDSSNSENPQPSLLGSILATFLPFVLIILLFLLLMNQVQCGGGRLMQFEKSKA